ncbi:MAG: glycosyltransferase family 4 protein [Candidatus Omnitrophica bacterium]|nr:glycosyltransferase family 4 protein [Candidatus Omnitrophota bacterium]
MTEKIRCVLLSEMLQPYRIPVFNWIARDERIELEVLLLSVREANRQWEIEMERCEFKHCTVPSKDFYVRSLDWGLHFNWGVKSALEDLRPDVVAGTGYVSPAYLTGQKWAKRNEAGYVLWSGSTAATSRIGKGPLKWMKKRFVRNCDAYLSYGTDATKQLVALGADPERVVTGCNTVDIEEFGRMAEEARSRPEFGEWRERYPKHLILFIGQMIERKGVRDLLRAFRSIKNRDMGLVLIGEGPEMERYRQEFEGVEGLYWEGYKQTRDLGPFLASADVLVMPSRLEIWGLVVNEAMAAGLPVIATTCSGSTTDLVEDGVTGYSFEAGDEMALSTLLKSVADHPERWAEIGRTARERIQKHHPREYARCFVESVILARQNTIKG